MYFLHAINSDRQTRLMNVLGQIAMILGDKKKLLIKHIFLSLEYFPEVRVCVLRNLETPCNSNARSETLRSVKFSVLMNEVNKRDDSHDDTLSLQYILFSSQSKIQISQAVHTPYLNKQYYYSNKKIISVKHNI